MRKGYKIALGIFLSAILLTSLAGISFAATQTTKTGFGYGLRLRAGSVTVNAVNKLLGIKQEDVRAQRLEGKSFADIAKEKGVDVEKLKDAILESRKALLQERVKDGTLTQEQADAILKQMESHISFCLENGAMPGGCNMGNGRMTGPGGMMGSGGMMGYGGGMMGFGTGGGWRNQTNVQ